MQKHPRPRAVPVILAAFISLAGAGCAGNTEPTSGQDASEVPPPAEEPQEEQGNPTPPAQAEPVSGDDSEALLRAIATAISAVPDSRLYSVDSEDDATAWEIETIDPSGTKFETLVSSDGSQIIDGPERESSDSEYLQKVDAAAISVSEIVAAALAHSPGRILELELDEEEGAIVWEVEVADTRGRTTEFDIDAATGEVIP